MRNLQSLLDRLTKVLDKDSHIKSTVAGVIKEKTGATINESNISIKNGVLELNTGPALKNEISLKESLIKEELKNRQIFFSRILYK